MIERGPGGNSAGLHTERSGGGTGAASPREESE